MDALALLCTLHADGPATLVRLRAADMATLDDVIAADGHALAALLRSSKLGAARFQKEALHLRERVFAEVGAADGAHERESVEVPPRNRAHEPAQPPVARPIERVLAAWREADRDEPTEPAASRDPLPGAIPTAAVDGLDAETARALAQAGVRDLGALATSDALTLSRATNLSFSKLVRLRALARRSASPPSAAPRALVPFSPAERPPEPTPPIVRFERDFVLEPLASEEGVGGPFA